MWMGDPAEIKAKRVRKPKTDRDDAKPLRDLRQLLWHRHRLVQMRTRIMNQLQALAMNENKRWKGKPGSEAGRAALEKLPLAFWASRRQSCWGGWTE